MGSAISKPRSLPKSVPKTAPLINRTDNVDQLFKIKAKLQKDTNTQSPDNSQQAINSTNNDVATGGNQNKTVSDFITKRLGNLQIEKEYLQLNPNHSSLKRLSNKKQLEDDYKKIIDNLGTQSATVLDVTIFKEIMLSIGSIPAKELMSRYRLSSKTLNKIQKLATVISIPTVKLVLPEQERRRQRLADDNEVQPTNNTSTGNELNEAFSNILEGSQAGYDLSSQKPDYRSKRASHREMNAEVKRTF